MDIAEIVSEYLFSECQLSIKGGLQGMGGLKKI